ncbi:MAG: 3-oxoacid CoA-transferase subunit A [Alphaproteobacteria bacterium]|jgi:3-oxoacid CoA-transferase A subunit|nr:3-oxoacid CoA-transferase subunit A [Alphaproteobacteria bacterium]
MIDKRVATVEEALDGLGDGASVMVNGFGGAGVPVALIRGLEALPARDLTMISNSMRFIDGYGPAIFADRRVKKVIATAARSRGPDTSAFERQWLDGELQVEMVPQGTFAERMRAGGGGIPAFFTPTGAGTDLAVGKEVRRFGGEDCILEEAMVADFALIRGQRADRWGNIAFTGTQGNFGLVMAMAARTTVVEVAALETRHLAPDAIHIPGIYVERVIERADERDGRTP